MLWRHEALRFGKLRFGDVLNVLNVLDVQQARVLRYQKVSENYIMDGINPTQMSAFDALQARARMRRNGGTDGRSILRMCSRLT